MWIYTSTPPYAFMASCLIRWEQGQLYLLHIRWNQQELYINKKFCEELIVYFLLTRTRTAQETTHPTILLLLLYILLPNLLTQLPGPTVPKEIRLVSSALNFFPNTLIEISSNGAWLRKFLLSRVITDRAFVTFCLWRHSRPLKTVDSIQNNWCLLEHIKTSVMLKSCKLGSIYICCNIGKVTSYNKHSCESDKFKFETRMLA
jgi:hypothetical protein